MSPRRKVAHVEAFTNPKSAPDNSAKLLAKILLELQQINDSIQDLAYQLRCLNISTESEDMEEDEDVESDVESNTEPSPH
ncbi:MAG: hypothetical protein K2Z81_02385 [Cyanobacteria bacterium]|nr:hypothetical protein [Cyanobacteriota bacterium]